VAQYLPYLLFLACPISMGLMMWMMMGRNHNQMSANGRAREPGERAAGGAARPRTSSWRHPQGERVVAQIGGQRARAYQLKIGAISGSQRSVTRRIPITTKRAPDAD